MDLVLSFMLNFLEDIKMNILQKLLYWGFNGNSWCWFHILAGGLLAKLFGFWVVVVLAFGWEIVEFFLDLLVPASFLLFIL